MFSEDELRAAYDERISIYRRGNETLIHLIENFLDDLASQHGVRPGFLVSGKPKTFESLYGKALRDGYDTVEAAFDGIRDIARARVVCQTLTDVERLVELLVAPQDAVYVEEIDDNTETPSGTGYRAVHLHVSVDCVL